MYGDEPIHCERCGVEIYVPRVFTPILCELCVMSTPTR
jgi:hypothetical protein